MTRLHQEMEHMKTLLACPTSFRAWRQYLEAKAQHMAEVEPDEFGQLPMMLAAEIARLRLQFKATSTPGAETRSSP
jgi:hypothetical protein